MALAFENLAVLNMFLTFGRSCVKKKNVMGTGEKYFSFINYLKEEMIKKREKKITQKSIIRMISSSIYLFVCLLIYYMDIKFI